ncbi:MAG: hypothetical protein UHS51_02420, partial [Atopobiaceae bacterium]|nr:hypothetical protein [Atopobiaceae bacterium]
MAGMKARCRIPKIDAAWAALLAAVATVALLVWPIAAYAEGLEGTPEVTRAQWIHELVGTFDVRVEDESYPEEYFSDVSENAPYYEDLVKAVEFGIIDVPAGGAVRANDAAERDFAAHTLNFCLGFQLQD